MYALNENLDEFLEDIYSILESRSDELGSPPDLVRGMALVEAAQRILKPRK